MAIPDFNLDRITIDDLTSLMSMQWDSLIAENSARQTTTSSTSTPSIVLSPSTPSTSLPILDDAEKARLTAARGCWNCQKVPTDLGWVAHVSQSCPGDALLGIRPGREFVPIAPTLVKKEFASATIFPAQEDDQPNYEDQEEFHPIYADCDTSDSD